MGCVGSPVQVRLPRGLMNDERSEEVNLPRAVPPLSDEVAERSTTTPV